MRQIGWFAVLLGCVLAVPALAAGGSVDRPQCNATMGASDAVFCEGYYALCIKALCKPAAETGKAECACTIEHGWSMGPAQCTAPGRSQTAKPATGTPIMSTYSNHYDAKDQTLTCSSDSTQWAWCYGAPCKVDGANGSAATCLCPVCTSAASTLGGNCQQDNCSKIWSAATPANDKFAATLFYEHLKHQGVKVLPPPAACPLTPPAH